MGGSVSQATSDMVRGNGLKLCQGGLDGILGKSFLQNGLSNIETSSPGKHWSDHSWKCSKYVWIWHLRIWFNSEHGGDAGLTAGLKVLKGLFQS